MLVDVRLDPSRMQQMVYCLALLLLSGLIWASGLAWILCIVLIGILLGISGWLNRSAVIHRIDAVWQGDSQTWYWQNKQGKRYSGELIAVRYLGAVIHLTLITSTTIANQQRFYVPIWRDQVNEQQWRCLKVLHVLNDSQQNWF
ncbi:MAG: hypothetical protein EOO69_10045 [Moraxellaceae bacterium]|nr:MAG: hypothetical protein EOO69_10045 [Moraxellaceae bacterium]